MAEATSRPAHRKRLAPDTLRKMDRHWHACNYLSAGMIYLRGQIIEQLAYAHAEGIDKEEVRSWTWIG